MYNKIVNPKTGRQVNINSNLGKKILTKYINYMDGGSTIAIRNPKKKVHFDETAEEWDDKCNELSYTECIDPDNEGSFNCKWRTIKKICIAIEANDIEELYMDDIGEDYYSELSDGDKEIAKKHTRALRESRLPGPEFIR